MFYKLQQTKEVWEAEGPEAALKFAAKLGCLGAARDAVQRGASAMVRPQFYQEIGQDPPTLVKLGLAALERLLRE